MRARAIAVLTVLMLGSTLSGCDIGVAWSPLSISRDGSVLLVAACSDMAVESVFGVSYKDSSEIEEVKFWVSSGHQNVNAGDVLSPTAAIPGMVASVAREPALRPGDWIEIVFNLGEENKEGSATGSFHIGPDGLAEDSWLQSNGEVSAEPCPEGRDYFD